MDEYDAETWSLCTISPDYQVSTEGRVRSLNRITPHGHRRKGKLLSQHQGCDGYLKVCLSVKGYTRPYSVHRLVAEAFLGPLPTGFHTRHGREGKLVNSLRNLSYGTPTQNEADKIKHGAKTNPGKRGTDNHNAKVTEADVVAIRAAYSTGTRQVDLAAKYSVTQSAISQIIRRKTWV